MAPKHDLAVGDIVLNMMVELDLAVVEFVVVGAVVVVVDVVGAVDVAGVMVDVVVVVLVGERSIPLLSNNQV